MQTPTENCPNCAAPLSPEGTCSRCGATVRGVYQGLDLGTLRIARAIEQGLDYYLLLGVRAEADHAEIENAYWERKRHLPENTTRLPPELVQRVELLEQAGHVLRDIARRQTYDRLRRQRQAYYARQTTNPANQQDAVRGLNAFRAGRYDDAARLLRIAARRNPQSEELHLQYMLSVLYGSSNLSSPEDWRVDEMRAALEQARTASSSYETNETIEAHYLLIDAIDHYDKDRFREGWQLMHQLNETLPDWYLPWIVSAFWCRREGKHADMLVRAERARRLQPDDPLIGNLIDAMRVAWSTMPKLLTNAARQAARQLNDGTNPTTLEATWR